MTMLFWISIFVLAVVVLVKGSDILLRNAEKIGLALGLSPFIVGIVMMGFGTSLPELGAGVLAASRGVTHVVTGNVVGSNIANILLVVGTITFVDRKLFVRKNLIDLDLPLLAGSTGLFLLAAHDGQITRPESLLLLATAIGYVAYVISFEEETTEVGEIQESILSKILQKRPWSWLFGKSEFRRPDFDFKTVSLVILGLVLLLGGAHLTVESMQEIAVMAGFDIGVLSLLGLALGTSLPELVMAVQAARKQKAELALGNIVGSCIFNLLSVIGVSGLVANLTFDPITAGIGIPVLIVATIILVVAGITRRIYAWEGMIFLAIYGIYLINALQQAGIAL